MLADYHVSLITCINTSPHMENFICAIIYNGDFHSDDEFVKKEKEKKKLNYGDLQH